MALKDDLPVAKKYLEAHFGKRWTRSKPETLRGKIPAMKGSAKAEAYWALAMLDRHGENAIREAKWDGE